VIELKKRYGVGIRQTLDRRAELNFDYTKLLILEKVSAVAKISGQELACPTIQA
jgi:hypothetical protein